MDSAAVPGRVRALLVVTALVCSPLAVLVATQSPVGAADTAPSVLVSDGSVSGSDDGVLGPSDLFVLGPSGMSRITHNAPDPDQPDFTPSSSSPSLSPDGSQIIYHRCQLGELIISMRGGGATYPYCAPHVMNVDGSGDRELETPEANRHDSVRYADYDWGPESVAFTNGGTLYRLNPWTGAATVIAEDAQHYWMDPSWSPDGTRLVVTGYGKDEYGDPLWDSPADIWRVDADGQNLTQLTAGGEQADETEPQWSPDGADIMYEIADRTGHPDSSTFCVAVMASDGTGAQCVNTDAYVWAMAPGAWSSDSLYLGVTFHDPEVEARRFGALLADGTDPTLIRIATLPPGSRTLDWLGDADLPPVADDQDLTVPGDQAVPLTLTGSDPDGDPLGFTVLTQPTHGALSGTAPELVYTPDNGYAGPDSFTFKVTARGKDSEPGTVSIDVTEPCTITGTTGNNTLTGTAGDDVICGFAGNDVIFGGGGDDILLGGSGDDDLVGQAGNDHIDGGGDDDAVRGDQGNDRLIGGEGSDLVSYLSATTGAKIDIATQSAAAGGSGSDELSGIENAFGTKYADQIYGDAGANQLFGGPGNDKLVGRAGRDELNGKAGADALSGGPDKDTLVGGTQFDALVGGGALDSCYVEADGGSRKSCEDGGDYQSARIAARMAAQVGRGDATYWSLGKDDYLFVFNHTATEQISYDAIGRDQAQWENNICFYLGGTPAAPACEGAKLKAIWKVFARENLTWWGYLKNGCTNLVLDLGRHAGYGFRKKWKIRPADNYNSHLSNYYTRPGDIDSIKRSDGDDYVDVTCPGF